MLGNSIVYFSYKQPTNPTNHIIIEAFLPWTNENNNKSRFLQSMADSRNTAFLVNQENVIKDLNIPSKGKSWFFNNLRNLNINNFKPRLRMPVKRRPFSFVNEMSESIGDWFHPLISTSF